MNARKIVIIITIISCLALTVILYMNLGTENVFWQFLYGVFFQMCFTLLAFSVGAFISRKKTSQAGPDLMKGAAISFVVVFVYWVVVIGAFSIYRAIA